MGVGDEAAVDANEKACSTGKHRGFIRVSDPRLGRTAAGGVDGTAATTVGLGAGKNRSASGPVRAVMSARYLSASGPHLARFGPA